MIFSSHIRFFQFHCMQKQNGVLSHSFYSKSNKVSTRRSNSEKLDITKSCVNCKHMIIRKNRNYLEYLCSLSFKDIDSKGNVNYMNIDEMRNSKNMCGPTGKLFQFHNNFFRILQINIFVFLSLQITRFFNFNSNILHTLSKNAYFLLLVFYFIGYYFFWLLLILYTFKNYIQNFVFFI